MDQEGKFEFIAELGRGLVGSVVLARKKKTGEQVAIKKLDRAHLQQSLTNDIINHRQLRHPHVVRFREVFLSPHYVNIEMEYAGGGSLFTYVQSRNRLREPLARWFFQQLILAVDYCHRKGLANIDITLENTLLQIIPSLPRPLVKLCAFDYSSHDDKSLAHSKAGQLTYTPPEAILSESYHGQAADIWSCGVVLYMMLVGRYPFQSVGGGGYGGIGQKPGQEVGGVLKQMQKQEFSLPDSLNLTSECKHLIYKLLNPDSKIRIKMSDILQDPWFRTDLPPEALTMNDKYLANTRTCPQSEAEIRAVIAAAAGVTVGGAEQLVAGSHSEPLQAGIASQQQHSLVAETWAMAETATQGAVIIDEGAATTSSTAAAEEMVEYKADPAAAAAGSRAAPVCLTPQAGSLLLPMPSYQVLQTLDMGLAGVNAVLARISSSSRQVLLLQLKPHTIPHQQQGQQVVIQQLQQAAALHHPHVLRIQGVYHDKQNGDGLTLMTDPCSCSLMQFVQQRGGRLSEAFARWLFQQLVLGLEFCHSRGIAGLPLQHTIVQVVPNLPQPVVKLLPSPLLANSSSLSTSHQQHLLAAAAQDVRSCGQLLVSLLNGRVKDSAAAEHGHGEHQFQQPLWVSHECQRFLTGLLQPLSGQMVTLDQILRHPWFTTDLPKGILDKHQQLLAQQHVQQQSGDMQLQQIAAAVTAAAAAARGVTALHELQRGLKLLQQKQQLCDQAVQLLSPGTLLHTVMHVSLYQIASALLGAQQAVARQKAAGDTSISRSRSVWPGYVLGESQQAVHMACRSLDAFQQQLQMQQQLSKQHQANLLQLVSMYLISVRLLAAAHRAVAAVQYASDLSGRCITLNSNPGMPLLPKYRHRLLQAMQQQQATDRMKQLISDPMLLTMVQVLGSPSAACTATAAVGLLALLLSPAVTSTSSSGRDVLEHQLPGGDLGTQQQYRVLQQDIQQQVPTLADSINTVIYTWRNGDTRLWIAGLVPSGGSSMAQQLQHGSSHTFVMLPAGNILPQPMIMSSGFGQYHSFVETIQQLKHAVGVSHKRRREEEGVSTLQGAAGSNRRAGMFSPILGLCCSSPLLLLNEPPAGTLEDWLCRQQHILNSTASCSSSSDRAAAWGNNAPWLVLLQILTEIAEALHLMHQQQKPAVHGCIHAGAVFLLQPLEDVPAQPHQQQQQREQQRLSQLSLISLWRQAASAARVYQPSITAGEILLHGAPVSPATDIYGFGILMLQLAACWVPQQHPPGSDQQIAEMRCCHKMLRTSGSTFPCGDAAEAAASEVASLSCDLASGVCVSWLAQLPPAELLPEGYVQLMMECCSRDATARPTAQGLLQQLARMQESPGM